MPNFVGDQTYNVTALDIQLKDIIGDTVYGVSNGDVVVIHLKEDASEQVIDVANAVLNGLSLIPVSSTKSTILANNVDSCVITAFSESDTTNWIVILNDSLVYATITGDNTLDFSTNTQGNYQLFCYNSVSLESGNISIVAESEL